MRRHKENVLSLALDIVWTNTSFSRPGEILQSGVQWLMETVWVAAEEKHCKEKEEGRIKDEKKALKKKVEKL